MSACGSDAFGHDIQEVEVSKDELAAVVEQAFGPRPATVSGHKLTDGNEVWYSASFSTKGYRIKHEGSDRKVCRRFTYFLDIGGPVDAPILTNVLHSTQFAFPDTAVCAETLQQLEKALKGAMSDIRPAYEEMREDDTVALQVTLTDVEAPADHFRLLIRERDAGFKLLRIEYAQVHD